MRSLPNQIIHGFCGLEGIHGGLPQFPVWNRASQGRFVQWSLNLSKDGDTKVSLGCQRVTRERLPKVFIYKGNQKLGGDAASTWFGMETPQDCG